MTILEKINIEKEKQLEAKRASEIERVDKQLKKDEKDIEDILELIHETVLFKKIERPYSSKKEYVIVTEEIFLEDYLSEPKSTWNKGIVWTEENEYKKHPYTRYVSVNGNYYYDIRNVILCYEQDIENLRGRMSVAKSKLDEIESQYKDMQEDFPKMVKMVTEWAEQCQKRAMDCAK